MDVTHEVPLLAGRWRVGAVIGRGAAADVHAATDEDGRPVAVKVVRTDDGDAVRRFERELAALEEVDHPGIVRVHDHGRCPDGRPFVVLDRVEGHTLADRLADGPLGAAAAADLGARMADALAHAHDRGVIHRDVKPANILVTGDDQPVLVDFGIARLDGASTLTDTGWSVGTPAYLAPEQLRGEPVTPKADVFALGLVVLEAATGERVFEGDLVTALARTDATVEVPDDLPPRLAAALRAMTRTEPERRPDAADVAERLAAVGDAGATTAFPVAATATTTIPVAEPVLPPAPEAVGPGGRRRWVLVGLVALTLVLALGWASRGGGMNLDVPTTTTAPAPTTTVVPTTAPLPPPPDGDEDGEDEEDGGRGNGNNGNGDGRGRERDD